MDFYERRAEELRQQLEEAERQERESGQKEVRPEDEAFDKELQQLMITTREEAMDALQVYLARLDGFLEAEKLSPQASYQEVNLVLVDKMRKLLLGVTEKFACLGIGGPEDIDLLDEAVKADIRVVDNQRECLRELNRFLHLFRISRQLDKDVSIGQIRDSLQARITELTKILESRREDT
jgi:hypothetical protein